MGRFIRFYSDLMNHLEIHVDDDTLSELENFDSEENNIHFGSSFLRSSLETLKIEWDEFLKMTEEKVTYIL